MRIKVFFPASRDAVTCLSSKNGGRRVEAVMIQIDPEGSDTLRSLSRVVASV